MKTEKAKELNEFLCFAIDLVLSTVEDGVLVPEHQLIDISELTEENFEKHFDAFEQELHQNIEEYKDYDIIYNYINFHLKDIYVWFGFEIDFINKIFIHNDHVNELIKAKQLIDKYKKRITNYLNGNNFSGVLFNQIDKLVFPWLYESLKEVEYKPDSKFNFEDLKKEITDTKLTTLQSIELINDRDAVFKQWQTINDSENEYDFTGKVIGKKHPLTNRYYRDFEKLCQLEIVRLKKKLEIEDAQIKHKAIENNKVVIQTTENSNYRWNSTDTDFLELFAALYQNESIVRADGKPLTRKEMLEYFQNILGLNIKDAEGKLNRATNRKLNMTPFIDSIKAAFETYAKDKEDRLESRR
jgi:hypothetical protein